MRLPDIVTWKRAAATLGVIASVLAIAAFVYPLVAETDSEETLRTTEEIRDVQSGMALSIETIVAALAQGDDPSSGFVKQVRSHTAAGDSLALLTSVGVRGGDWASTPVFMAPGHEMSMLVSLANAGENRLTDVTLGLALGERITYVEGSTEVFNGNHEDGVRISVDDVNRGGLNLGNYAPNGWSYITLTLRAADAVDWNCGTHPADVVAVATATSDETGEELPILVAAPLLYVDRVC